MEKLNDLESKIIKFFEKELKCPIEYFLKNKEENPTGEFLGGMEEIELPPYAIIYDGKEDMMLNDENYKKIIYFERENNTDFTKFYLKNCNPVEGVLEQLKSEEYEIIYKRFEQELKVQKLRVQR